MHLLEIDRCSTLVVLIARGYVAVAPGAGVLHETPLIPRVFPFDVRPDGFWFVGNRTGGFATGQAQGHNNRDIA